MNKKELKNYLDEWIYHMAYFTDEDKATPEGVKKWIIKQLDDTIVIKSKGQARRIAIQNPKLFDSIAESRGYIRKSDLNVENIMDIILKCKSDIITKHGVEATIRDIAEAVYNSITKTKEKP